MGPTFLPFITHKTERKRRVTVGTYLPCYYALYRVRVQGPLDSQPKPNLTASVHLRLYREKRK